MFQRTTTKFKGHIKKVNTVKIDPSSKIIASGGDDMTIRLWDTVSGKQIAMFNHENLINDICWSLDGKYLAIAGRKYTYWYEGDNKVKIWDLRLKKLIKIFKHDYPLNNICWSPDNNKILSAGRACKIWDFNTGKEIYNFHKNTWQSLGAQKLVSWSSSGKKIAIQYASKI